MKKIQLLIGAILLSGSLMAQTALDALRYSLQNYNGTARSTAMGGAFGALGGDFSSLSTNPAGLGVYRTSEFTFTPSLELSQAKNSGITQDKYSFTVGNLGYVATFKPRLEDKSGWKNFNIGFGYNRVNNFRRDALLQVFNSPSSLLDVFENSADGIHPDNLAWPEYLAYETYLLDPVEEGSLDYAIPLGPGDKLNQRKNLVEKGHIGEYVLSFGANYDHKLYLGASLGIQDLYYKSTSDYTEMPAPGAISDLDDYTYQEYVKTSGYGFNFKFGAIYRPIEELRLGVAVHTPTFYRMSDEFQNTMTAHFKTPDLEGNFNYQASSDLMKYDYDFETPFRTILSAAYLFGKKAMISVDYEFIDYSDAKFSDGEDGFDFYGTPQNPEANDIINNIYQSTGNLRVGGEYRLNSYVSLRAGYAHFGSPYKSGELNSDSSYSTYSAGWGLKRNNFFFDMAYQYSSRDERSVFYDDGVFTAIPSNLTTDNHQLRMTFGFKF